MSVGPNESDLLIAFARAAAQAQEIEALFQEMLIAAEVATDTKNRSFEKIAAEIEKQPLGPLKQKFIEVAQMADPLFAEMWKRLNAERIFLIHKFFTASPIANTDSFPEAAQRPKEIDELLSIGCRLLTEVRDGTYATFNTP